MIIPYTRILQQLLAPMFVHSHTVLVFLAIPSVDTASKSSLYREFKTE